jgi:DUF971 family protein
VRESPEPIELTDIQPVGNYALRLVWRDGHQTGIYSHRFLPSLCACSSCVGDEPKSRSFSRE